jgi:hypothetical protein
LGAAVPAVHEAWARGRNSLPTAEAKLMFDLETQRMCAHTARRIAVSVKHQKEAVA